MKNIFFIWVAVFFFSCSGGEETTTTDQGSKNLTPVENVHGNIPDTINNVSPGGESMPLDSSHSAKKDSAR